MRECLAGVAPVVPPFDTVVDGRQGKSKDQVSPDGVIVYQFIEQAMRFYLNPTAAP